jgi:hypothetical protein
MTAWRPVCVSVCILQGVYWGENIFNKSYREVKHILCTLHFLPQALQFLKWLNKMMLKSTFSDIHIQQSAMAFWTQLKENSV